MYTVNHETDRQLPHPINIKPAAVNRPPDKHRKNGNDAILKNKELLAIVPPDTKSRETNEQEQQWIHQQQQFDPKVNSNSALKSGNNVQKGDNEGKGDALKSSNNLQEGDNKVKGDALKSNNNVQEGNNKVKGDALKSSNNLQEGNKGKKDSPSKVNAPKITSKNHNQALPQQKPPPVVLTTTNSVFLDFTQNWLESIRRLKVRPKNITIVTEDEATYEALAEYPEVYRVKPSFMLPPNKTLVFDTPEYKAFVNKRPKYILDLLEKNIDVLFSDVDTVWIEDPFPYFQGDFDLFIQEDQPQPKLVLCAGFAYYRSTANMIQFLKYWIRRLEINKNKKPDQMVLNIMLREKKKAGKTPGYFKYKVLDQKKFLSGRDYFDEDWRRNNTDVKPAFLHNNWVVGHDIKVERFKKLGYWYI